MPGSHFYSRRLVIAASRTSSFSRCRYSLRAIFQVASDAQSRCRRDEESARKKADAHRSRRHGQNGALPSAKSIGWHLRRAGVLFLAIEAIPAMIAISIDISYQHVELYCFLGRPFLAELRLYFTALLRVWPVSCEFPSRAPLHSMLRKIQFYLASSPVALKYYLFDDYFSAPRQ